MTDALREFLRARIGEDEAAARAAEGNRWRTTDREYVDIEDADRPCRGVVYSSSDGGCTNWETAEHIARWDPARVLTDCAARRLLIAETERFDTAREYDAFGAESTYERLILTHLALPYADHPDFREEWRP